MILRTFKIIVFLLISYNSFFAQTGNSILLKLENSFVNFDTTKVGTTKKIGLRIKNIGDSKVSINSLDRIQPPFYCDNSFPFNLTTGEEKSLDLKYIPLIPQKKDVQVITLSSNADLNLSVILLFDVSGSMNEWFSIFDPKSKIQAANDAGSVFLDELYHKSNHLPEIAIYSFSEDCYRNQRFTSDISALKSSFPQYVFAGTCLYNSISRTIDDFGYKNGKKVLVVLTDGFDNCGGISPYSLVNKAINNSTTIYTIGIGHADQATLEYIARNTGGKYLTANSSRKLVELYQFISNDATERNLTLTGNSVGETGTFQEPTYIQTECACQIEDKLDGFYIGPACTIPMTIGGKIEYRLGNFSLMGSAQYIPKVGRFDDDPPPADLAAKNNSWEIFGALVYHFPELCRFQPFLGFFGGISLRHFKKPINSQLDIQEGDFTAKYYGAAFGIKFHFNENIYLENAFGIGLKSAHYIPSGEMFTYKAYFLQWIAIGFKL